MNTNLTPDILEELLGLAICIKKDLKHVIETTTESIVNRTNKFSRSLYSINYLLPVKDMKRYLEIYQYNVQDKL